MWRYGQGGTEPTLNEVIHEPVLRLIMERDHVAEEAIEGIAVTVSIGVAASRPEEEKLEATLPRVDAALYKAKRAGGNRVVG